jgi:ubiquitin C-terminal hydrolase
MFVSLKLLTYPQDLRQFINSLNFPNVHSQNDQHEFMMFLLNKMQTVASTKLLIRDIIPAPGININISKDIRYSSKIWKKANDNLYQYGYNINNNAKSNSIYLSHASKFIGQRIYKKKCNNTTCGYVSVSFETFSSLDVILNNSLSELKHYLTNEYLSETECTMKCKKCGWNSATSSVRIWKKPKIMLIALGRNVDARNKNNTYVEIPKQLNISEISIFPQKRDYVLHGFLSHHGRSFNSGHCSYSYLHGDTWYTFDDNNVSNYVNYADAYIICYT